MKVSHSFYGFSCIRCGKVYSPKDSETWTSVPCGSGNGFGDSYGLGCDTDGSGYGDGHGRSDGSGDGYGNGCGDGHGHGSGNFSGYNDYINFGQDIVDCGTPEAVILEVHEE